MSPDAELMLIFGALHLVALAMGGVLFVLFLRSETTTAWQPPEDDDPGGGGGGNDRLPAPPTAPPPGGIPLPDAEPGRRRLRDHGRLADAYDRGARRPAHPPVPVREPERQR